MANNFDDLAMAVAAFGANNRVILDDLGYPSIMVGVPKMKYSDIITDGTQEVLPWWIVDGVEKDVIWVSKYPNIIKHDRAYSLAAKDPAAVLDCIKGCAYFIDRVKIGKLNYPLSGIDWAQFGRDAVAACAEMGLDYYIKDSLRAEMDKL